MYNTLLQKRLWQSCNLNSYCLMLIILADLLLLGSCGCVQASLWSLQMLAGFCICSFLLAWHYACPVDIVIKMDERIELVFSMEASCDLSCPVFLGKLGMSKKDTYLWNLSQTHLTWKISHGLSIGTKQLTFLQQSVRGSRNFHGWCQCFDMVFQWQEWASGNNSGP